jgi:hypothetical protein
MTRSMPPNQREYEEHPTEILGLHGFDDAIEDVGFEVVGATTTVTTRPKPATSPPPPARDAPKPGYALPVLAGAVGFGGLAVALLVGVAIGVGVVLALMAR